MPATVLITIAVTATCTWLLTAAYYTFGSAQRRIEAGIAALQMLPLETPYKMSLEEFFDHHVVRDPAPTGTEIHAHGR